MKTVVLVIDVQSGLFDEDFNLIIIYPHQVSHIYPLRGSFRPKRIAIQIKSIICDTSC